MLFQMPFRCQCQGVKFSCSCRYVPSHPKHQWPLTANILDPIRVSIVCEVLSLATSFSDFHCFSRLIQTSSYPISQHFYFTEFARTFYVVVSPAYPKVKCRIVSNLVSCLQGPSQILQVARWFAAASEQVVASNSHWAEPRGELASGPMPVCRFKNKFAFARADVPDG